MLTEGQSSTDTRHKYTALLHLYISEGEGFQGHADRLGARGSWQVEETECR